MTDLHVSSGCLLRALVLSIPLLTNNSVAADVNLTVGIASVPPERGYDQESDRFDPKYLSGTALLQVNACSGLKTFRIDTTAWTGQRPQYGQLIHVPPAGVVAWRWKYTTGTNSLTKEISNVKDVGALIGNGPGTTKVDDASTACKTELEVDAGKPYTVQVELITADGTYKSSDIRIGYVRPATLIVSIGDSFASGEGQPDVRALVGEDGKSVCEDHTSLSVESRVPQLQRKAVWKLRERGHRSLRSGHAIAALKLESTHAPITFVSLAASGARFEGITGQVNRLLNAFPSGRIDALVISAGGNSVGFSALMKGAANGTQSAKTLRNTFNHLFDSSDPSDCPGVLTIGDSIPAGASMCETIKSIAGSPPRSFETKLSQLVDRVKELNPKRALWVGYPISFFDDYNGAPSHSCGIFRTCRGGRWSFCIGDSQGYGVDNSEAYAIKESANKLNNRIQKYVREHRIVFVDLRRKFATHGYCSNYGAKPYFVGAEESCYTQGDFNGMMHPNSLGATAMAEEIAAQLVRLVPVPLTPNLTISTNELRAHPERKK